jgi:hypothetical protein
MEIYAFIHHPYSCTMAMELALPDTTPPQRPSATYSSLSELSKPFLIDPSLRSYKHQYANIYFVRLVELRPIVEERAGERWGGVRGKLWNTIQSCGLAELNNQANHLYYHES